MPNTTRQADMLKMQRLNAEGSYKQLIPMIANELKGLSVPASVREQFKTFTASTDLDPALREEVVENILGWINQARKQKEG